MPSNAGRFARSVLSTYEARRDPLTVFASKSAGWSTPTGPDHLGTIGARPMGHPAFADLPLGASDHCEAAALFLDLDSHDAYATTDDDPTRLVPNPAKKKAHQHVLAARARYERALATADAAMLEAVSPPPGQSVLITNHAHDTITADLATRNTTWTPPKPPTGRSPPDSRWARSTPASRSWTYRPS